MENPLTDPGYQYTEYPADLYFVATVDFRSNGDGTSSLVDIDPRVVSVKDGSVFVFRSRTPPYDIFFAWFLTKANAEKVHEGDTDVKSFVYVDPEPYRLGDNVVWVPATESARDVMDSMIRMYESYMLDGNTPQEKLEQIIEVLAEGVIWQH